MTWIACFLAFLVNIADVNLKKGVSVLPDKVEEDEGVRIEAEGIAARKEVGIRVRKPEANEEDRTIAVRVFVNPISSIVNGNC